MLSQYRCLLTKMFNIGIYVFTAFHPQQELPQLATYPPWRRGWGGKRVKVGATQHRAGCAPWGGGGARAQQPLGPRRDAPLQKCCGS